MVLKSAFLDEKCLRVTCATRCRQSRSSLAAAATTLSQTNQSFIFFHQYLNFDGQAPILKQQPIVLTMFSRFVVEQLSCAHTCYLLR